jgi:hypothetical protein
MKKASASPADNLSPLGGAVPNGDPAESAADGRDLVVLSTPAEEPPVMQSSLAGDDAAEHAPQSGDNGAASHAGSVKKEMPPVLVGHATPALQARAKSFYRGVAEMFERWAARHGSSHTRRAYRRDVLSFVEFMSLRWPEQAEELLRASVADVQRWRDAMREQSKAPSYTRSSPLLRNSPISCSGRSVFASCIFASDPISAPLIVKPSVMIPLLLFLLCTPGISNLNAAYVL